MGHGVLEQGEAAVKVYLIVLENLDQAERSAREAARITKLGGDAAADIEGMPKVFVEAVADADVLLPVLVDAPDLVADEARNGLRKDTISVIAPPAEAGIGTVGVGATSIFAVNSAAGGDVIVAPSREICVGPDAGIESVFATALLLEAELDLAFPGGTASEGGFGGGGGLGGGRGFGIGDRRRNRGGRADGRNFREPAVMTRRR